MEGIDLLWNNKNLLMDGLVQTLTVAVTSLIFSCLGGLIMGWLRYIRHPAARAVTRVYLECFRVIPLMVWLFIAYFTIPTVFDSAISGRTAAILVFSLWGAAEMGELVRGSLQSLPKIQWESGTALGLSSVQLYRYILLPQAVRRLIPGTINLATRLIKTTSMASLVGVIEIIKRGQQIIERTKQPFAIYVLIFILFFILCYPLSVLSKRLERY